MGWCEVTNEHNRDSDNKPDLPWQLPEEIFLPIDNVELIGGVLEKIRGSHGMMTLVVDDGQVFEKCLLTNIDDGMLHIDKPLDWNGHNGSFRVFFRDHENYWRFFRTDKHSHNPFSLSVEVPSELFLLQRRRYKRVAVPPGTRAIAKTGRSVMTTLCVRDISASGLLFCSSVPDEEYPIDDFFQDIVISVPQSSESASEIPVRKVMPLINSGRIVRTFVDGDTSRSCFGISFEYESNYVREELCRLVKDVELAA